MFGGVVVAVAVSSGSGDRADDGGCAVIWRWYW